MFEMREDIVHITANPMYHSTKETARIDRVRSRFRAVWSQRCAESWGWKVHNAGTIIVVIIIIIYSLTPRVVGARQMISQPVSWNFPCSPLPSGTWWTPELQACPFPDVVFPPFPLSALSSSPFYCALQDGFGQTWWTGNMTIPLQFTSLYDGQEVFVWPDCLLDLGTDFLISNMVCVWDA